MTGDTLPHVTRDAAFVPFHLVGGRPNVVVDCHRTAGTVLALSHWPGAGTPEDLAADTSAAIVDRYLDAAPSGPPVGLVTNDHFDEDGLFALWLLVTAPPAGTGRALALAAAEAGDFLTWNEPPAVQCALAAMAMAERGTTPFANVRRALGAGVRHDPAGELYLAVLPWVGRLLDDPDRFRLLWQPGWRRVEEDMALFDSGDATIEEVPAADLAIVRAPRRIERLAVYPRTSRMRVLTAIAGGDLRLEHRYETWVRYVSRRLPPRVDLAPLTGRLQALERNAGAWVFDGVRAKEARLWLAGPSGRPAPSTIEPQELVEELVALRNLAPSG